MYITSGRNRGTSLSPKDTKMITQKELDTLKELQSQAGTISGKISDHIHKALEIICEVYGGELDWWDYADYCEECECGGEMSLSGGSISINVVPIKPLTLDGCVWPSVLEEFPIEFLFKTLDEIRKLVSASKAKEEKKVRQKEQRLARKAKKDALKISAKNKLTPEEAKALGLK
ncbi:hypothetical protein LCGC14_1490420 [marine sediment metagenome]|uniref:Uncharacterized protein n=1 Tax=marine sediment metagenome TaxID=412755 RepID=A0A0F9J7J5_9ZZZZ